MALVGKFCRSFRENAGLGMLSVVVGCGGLVAYNHVRTGNGVNIVEPIKKKKVVVLGTGWGATSFVTNLKDTSYEVHIISPRKHFTFTPLLPSVACGSVGSVSTVEPIRRIMQKCAVNTQYDGAECFKIDPINKKVYCHSNSPGKEYFVVDFDYLVIAVGTSHNTFDIQGVEEHAFILKEVEDAQRIHRAIINCFEKSSLQHLTDKERKNGLHFVVVGGGPTGVEFAAQLHDSLNADLAKLYPTLKHLVKITILDAADHILSRFDEQIITVAEGKFRRNGIRLKTGSMVLKVDDKKILAKKIKSRKTYSIPYGMIVWATGSGTRPIITDFMKQIGQDDRLVLATDEWLRVDGCDNIYAIGDCATINQRDVLVDLAAKLQNADIYKSGTLAFEDFKKVVDDICEKYPQVLLYFENKWMRSLLRRLIEQGDGVNIAEFNAALSEVEKRKSILPATAQLAFQQGVYLADCFNRMKDAEKNPEGPLPFSYEHVGQHAPVGEGQTAVELIGNRVEIGKSSQWYWYCVCLSQMSWRMQGLVVYEWIRHTIFGRDSTGF